MQFYAKDVMTTPVQALRERMSLQEALKFLAFNHISGAPVVNAQGALVGVVSLSDLMAADATTPDTFYTEEDLQNLIGEGGLNLAAEDALVGQVMTRTVFSVHPDTPLEKVANLMFDQRIHRVLVTDDVDRPVGMVSTFDLLKVLADRSYRA
jgi:CBS domain-containing protein